MDDFINVTKKDPQVRIEINNMLDRCIRIPYNYQLKVGYDTLIQNGTLKVLINIMSTTKTDIDIELKMEISRVK